MSVQHTPGDWNTERGCSEIIRLNDHNGRKRLSIEIQTFSPLEGEHELNLSLVAAAPNMLAALKDTLRMLHAAHMSLGMDHNGNPRVIKARAVVAKAESGAL